MNKKRLRVGLAGQCADCGLCLFAFGQGVAHLSLGAVCGLKFPIAIHHNTCQDTHYGTSYSIIVLSTKIVSRHI